MVHPSPNTWYYSTAAINTAALRYHIDLDQPIGYFGTNPNVPPAALVTGNSQLLPIWVGITYSPTTPTVGVSPAPGTGVTMQILIPQRETVITKVSTEAKNTELVKVTYDIKSHGHMIHISKLVNEKVGVQAYRSVKKPVWVTVSKSIRVFNPNG